MVATTPQSGRVTQVIGSTLDAEFPEDRMPALYNALHVKVERMVGTETVDELLTCEVASHLGGGRIRAVALGSTDGLKRGTEITDTGAAREMARTVEDPNRHINRQIASWVRERDLVLDGVNLSEAIRKVTNPLLVVLARGDGIVPPQTAAWPYEHVGSRARKLVEVGTQTVAMAHADMFVSKHAHERVFEPIRDWLVEQQVPHAEESSERID